MNDIKKQRKNEILFNLKEHFTIFLGLFNKKRLFC